MKSIKPCWRINALTVRFCATKKSKGKKINEELKELESRFAPKTEIGRRRTDFGTPPVAVAAVRPTVEEALAPVRGERIAIVLSAKDWIRAAQGAMPTPDAIKFRDGDSLFLTASARSSSRLAVLGSNGAVLSARSGASAQ